MNSIGPLTKEIHYQSAAVLKALARGFKLPSAGQDFRDIDLMTRLEKPGVYYIEEALTSIIEEEDGVTLYSFGLRLAQYEASHHWFVLVWRQYEGDGAGEEPDMVIDSIDLRVERDFEGKTDIDVLQSYQGQDDGQITLTFNMQPYPVMTSDYLERLIDGVNYLDRIPNLPMKMAKPIGLFLAGLRFMEGQAEEPTAG